MPTTEKTLALYFSSCRRALPLAALAFLLASTGASAQQTLSNVFSGFSSDPRTPIEITADRLVGNDAKKIATYKGNVIAVRGDYTLKTIELEVHYSGRDDKKSPSSTAAPDGQQVRRIIAKESVVLTSSKDQSATAKHADYDVIGGLLVLTGDVFIKQGQSVVCGQRVQINLKSGEYTVERDPNAAAKINPACPQGRVSTVLYPQQRDQALQKSQKSQEKTEPATRTTPKPFLQRQQQQQQNQ
ncbi:MAG: lipopolysaccharide transport periplasmic protein LptA [Hyphomicrobiaceae bacterium]|nr:MAG: lipopolysaccharide transport periplasmic protein LptA [Hyphomicrobiaceae bacterium]